MTCNDDFAGGDRRLRRAAARSIPKTWISRRIEASYRAMHLAGYAHSIEVWDGETLVGGLYGVGFDRVFCGESMFSRAANASKVALAWLVAAMRRGGIHAARLPVHHQPPRLARRGRDPAGRLLASCWRERGRRPGGRGDGAGVAAARAGACAAAFGAALLARPAPPRPGSSSRSP